MANISTRERFELAVQHHLAQRVAKARELYQEILEDEPENADVLHLLGKAELESGEPEHALELFEHCLAAARPDAPNATKLLGATFNLRGEALRHLGRYEEAIESYRRSLEHRPRHAGVYNNIGVALRHLERLDEAALSLQTAIEIDPGFAEAHNNLGNVLRAQGKREAAIHAYDRAILHKPRLLEAHNNLGNELRFGGEPDLAIASYERALSVRPDQTDVLVNLVHAASSAANWKKRDSAVRRLEPLTTRQLASGGHVSETAFVYALYGDDPERLRRLAGAEMRHSGPCALHPPALVSRAGGPIRIGYLVCGSARQPARRILANLTALHDRRRFAVHVYVYGDARGGADDTETDLTAMSNAVAAQRIAQDDLDVLVDLVGHQPGGRPAILAARPARLNMAWPVFCTPSSPPSADVLVTDEIVVPRVQAAALDERVVHLRVGHQWLSHDRAPLGPMPARSAEELPDDAVVLACFARALHLDPLIFDTWLTVLRHVEGAVLWLGRTNPETLTNLVLHAESRGVARDRLIFARRVRTKADHLARLGCADLCLAGKPLGAPTAVLDALWAGVPTIVLGTPLAPNRADASVMHAAGLPDLVAPTVGAYRAKLMHLAQHAEAREVVRLRLAAARARQAFGEPGPIVRELEDAIDQLLASLPSPAQRTAAAAV